MATPFIGEVQQVGFNWAPVDYALCDGQLLQISQYQALFALLGDTFGGDARTTVGLPDLRGRVPVGIGLDIVQQGQKLGTETVTLTELQITHNHPLQGSDTTGNYPRPASTSETYPISNVDSDVGYTTPANLKPIADGSVSSVGGGQSHTNMQPYQVICFIIALDGLFPSRN